MKTMTVKAKLSLAFAGLALAVVLAARRALRLRLLARLLPSRMWPQRR